MEKVTPAKTCGSEGVSQLDSWEEELRAEGIARMVIL
jgi:hypothetical protein